MSMKHYEQVVEFMNTFGQDVHTTFKMPSTKLAQLRFNLIEEEVGELQEAIDNDDIVEIADALTDILYVVHGAHAAFGTVPHMSRDADGPWTDMVITQLPDVRFSAATMGYFTRNLHRLNDAFDPDMVPGLFVEQEVTTALDNLLATTYKFAWLCGIDIYACFEEVHSSNMSKVCKTQVEAENSIQWRIETASTSDVAANYTGATFEEINGFFVIKRKADGKALKGRQYFDPDLARIVKLR